MPPKESETKKVKKASCFRKFLCCAPKVKEDEPVKLTSKAVGSPARTKDSAVETTPIVEAKVEKYSSVGVEARKQKDNEKLADKSSGADNPLVSDDESLELPPAPTTLVSEPKEQILVEERMLAPALEAESGETNDTPSIQTNKSKSSSKIVAAASTATGSAMAIVGCALAAFSGAKSRKNRSSHGKHFVLWGQNLFRISMSHKTTIQAMVDLNEQIVDPDLIYAGDTLRY